MKQSNLLSILILFFSLLNVQSVVGDVTRTANITNSSSPYYAYPENNNNVNVYNETYKINLSYPCNKITFVGKTNTACKGTTLIKGDYITESTQRINDDGDTYEKNIDTKTTYLTFEYTYTKWDAATTINIKDIKAYIAPHIILNTPSRNDLGKVPVGETRPVNIDFKSFLTSGNLTVTTDNSNFLINGKDTKITLCGGNTLEKLNENTKNFQVVYSANKNKIGEDKANITIKDEGNQNSVTIEIVATCVKKSNTINWNGINTQIPIGESVSLDNVTATSNGNITFTSSDPAIIKVENNQLVALKDGNVTITAKVAENDEYKAAESTLEFEATQKTIQNIVWKQDFYLLKVGDDAITLNAKAADKETGFENGNLIEYSVAEGGESVVTITDRKLHIVGKGQTSIIAHQRGNETYAATFLKKTVIVREVSDDCTSSYALLVTEPKEEGCDVLCGFSTQSFRVTHQLATRGDKLSFITDCTDATVSREVKVTDQNGRTIYDDGFGEVKNLQLNKDVTALTFFVQGNFRIRLSNIFVTQASYLETTTENINFAGSEVGKTGTTDIVFYWQNQPDMMRATIEDDEDGVFSVDPNTYIFGGTCGESGTSTVKTIFNPKKSGNYSANLVIYRGEGEKMTKMTTIPITATAIRTPQIITWKQELSLIKKGESYTLTATSSSGLVITYKSSDENVAKIEGNVLTVLGVGDVTITASQSGNDAYEPATEETKKLIAYDDQTITWNQEFGTLRVNDQITLTATSSSGLAVTYTSSNENVAKIEGNKLIVVGIGSATITASQAGNTYYTQATDITKVITSQASYPIGLTATEVGYTYANLSWSKVESATGYKIYDNNNLVATISDGNTTNTRINLPYAETNHSISISSIFSDSESDKSNPITFTSPVYPTTGDVTISNVTPNSFTVSWGKTNSTNANQPFNNYTIHVYEYDDEGNPKGPAMVYETINTSIEITGLNEDVTYDAFVGVLTTIGKEIIHPSSNENGITYWRAQRTRTTLFGEKIKGVYWFKDKWWIADRNTIYDLCDESFKLDLDYPCKYMSYQMMCNWLSSNNTVAINTNDVFLTKHQNIPTTKYREFEINPLNTDVYKIEIYRGGDDISGAVGTALDMNLRNIMVEIAPHILLNETEDVVIDKTKTTPTLTPSASINFKEITIGQESNVNIDFKSFLASGNITATLSDNKNFKINNLTDGIVAQNNTLKQLGTNNHNFTVSFTPQEKTDDPDNRDYSATLTIKDDANTNTVVINLNGKSKYRSVSIENKAIPEYYDETTYYSTITHTITYSKADLADWLWISSPFDAEISIKHNDTGTELPLTWAGEKAPNACYLLKYYDTAERAQGVVKPWKDVKTTDGKPIIKAGKGYILGVDPRNYEGNFTITYTSVNKEKNASNKNGYSGKTQDYTSESDPILSNIHLVGSGLFENAFGVNINSSDNVYFAVRAEAGNSNYYNYYFQNSVQIAPYSSFFMQYAGEYTFTTSQTTRQNAPAAFNNENSTEYYQLNITSEKYTDKTMILMDHNGSEGYAVGQDFFYMTQQAAGGNIANQFYSLDGDNPLSFNHRKNENQTIALGGCVKYAGEYSISLESSNISAQSVVLYDIFTDTTVDLLSEEYNFTTEKGSLNGRFIVTFSFAPQTTTEIFTTTANQIIVSGNAQNCTIDNLLVGKQVMIFDIMGRLIYNEKTNNKTINISLPTGTYIVRQADNWAKFAIR